jgi:hypothetical protein
VAAGGVAVGGALGLAVGMAVSEGDGGGAIEVDGDAIAAIAALGDADGAGAVEAASGPGDLIGSDNPPRTKRKPTDAADASTSTSADAITGVDGFRRTPGRATTSVVTRAPRR